MSKTSINMHDVNIDKLDLHAMSYKDHTCWFSLTVGEPSNDGVDVTFYISAGEKGSRRARLQQFLRNLAVATSCAMVEFEEQLGNDEINVRITNRDFAEETSEAI